MISNQNYSTDPVTLVLPAATGPTPVEYNDPVKRPDKYALAEELINLLDDTDIDNVGHAFACYMDVDSSDIFLETFPYAEDIPGTQFRISITRTNLQAPLGD